MKLISSGLNGRRLPFFLVVVAKQTSTKFVTVQLFRVNTQHCWKANAWAKGSAEVSKEEATV